MLDDFYMSLQFIVSQQTEQDVIFSIRQFNLTCTSCIREAHKRVMSTSYVNLHVRERFTTMRIPDVDNQLAVFPISLHHIAKKQE